MVGRRRASGPDTVACTGRRRRRRRTERRREPVGGRRAVLEVVRRRGGVGIELPFSVAVWRRRRGPGRDAAGPGRRRRGGDQGESEDGSERVRMACAPTRHARSCGDRQRRRLSSRSEPPLQALKPDVGGLTGSGPMPAARVPWEAPLGAFPTPGGNTRFRVWAPRARELALVRGGARARMEDEGLGVFAPTSPPAPAATTPTWSTASRCPTRAAAGSRRACAARRGCSTRAPSPGPTTAGARRPCATPCCTSCTSARSRRRGPSRRSIPHLRALPRSGSPRSS